MQQKRCPDIILTALKPATVQLSPPSSPMMSPSRRRKKLVETSKTQEQLIIESYQQLTDYIQTFDKEVKNVVQNCQAEFLNAYRQHTKNVKMEIYQIKKNSLKVMGEQQHYIDRIEVLEKELIMFREDSLELFQKNIKLSQEVQKLNFQLKQSKEEHLYMEKSLASVMKQNKRASVTLESIKDKSHQESKKMNRNQNIQTLQKTIPTTEDFRHQNLKEERPSTMSVRFNNRRIQLGIHSMKKSNLQPKEEIESGSHLHCSERKVLEFRQSNKDLEVLKEVQKKLKSGHFERKGDFGLRYKMSHHQANTRKIVDEEVKKLKSQQLATRNEYQKIFVDCVEQVRKEILRKSGITGLNYFSTNGPRDFQQFKAADYHLLLYLFLKNEQVMHVVFDILFPGKG